MFDYKVLNAKIAGGEANQYLNEYGQFFCLNLYTGQFFYRS